MLVQVYTAMMDLCISKVKESEGLSVGPDQISYCLQMQVVILLLRE